MPTGLVVHGGAGDITGESIEMHRRGVQHAATVAWQILERGGTSLDAVEQAIVLLEDDPAFDAGIGSYLNRDGVVEMDASIMAGNTLDAGAVAGIRHIQNPIRLARLVLESEHTLLIGEGAEKFGKEAGLSLVDNDLLKTPSQVERWKEYSLNPPALPRNIYLLPCGTVGCAAVDRAGNVAAGTSTGGMRFKRPGRVGDSPLIGCGVYADNLLGGSSATGWGESITRVVLCKYAVDALEEGQHPQVAAKQAIELLARRVSGQGGIIIVDRLGRIGFSHNTSRMAVAFIQDDIGSVQAIC